LTEDPTVNTVVRSAVVQSNESQTLVDLQSNRICNQCFRQPRPDRKSNLRPVGCKSYSSRDHAAHISLTPRFNGHFPGGPELAGIRIADDHIIYWILLAQG